MFKYSDSNIMVTISDDNLILWFSSDLQYFGDPISGENGLVQSILEIRKLKILTKLYFREGELCVAFLAVFYIFRHGDIIAMKLMLINSHWLLV